MSPAAADPVAKAALELSWKLVEQTSAPQAIIGTPAGADVLFSGPGGHNSMLGEGGSSTPTPLQAEGYLTDLAVGADGLYASATIERSYIQEFFSEAPRTDMSIVKLSSDGGLVWQVGYSQPGWHGAAKIVADPRGGAVALGYDGGQDTMLVWSVDTDGRTRWVKSFGTELGAVALLPSGGVVVLGTDGIGDQQRYSEDVVLWFLDRDGNTTNRVVVRKSINTQMSNYFFRGSLAVTNDSIVVASEWPDRFSKLQPLIIAGYDLDGALRWTREIGNVNCMGDLAATPTGDILMACREAYQAGVPPSFDLARYDGRSGSDVSEQIAIPDCSNPQYWLKVRIGPIKDRTVTLLGMQPEPSDNRRSCAWVGRTQLPGPQ